MEKRSMCTAFLKAKQIQEVLNVMLVLQNSRMEFKVYGFWKNKEEMHMTIIRHKHGSIKNNFVCLIALDFG